MTCCTGRKFNDIAVQTCFTLIGHISSPCLKTLMNSPTWKRPTSCKCCLSSSVAAALLEQTTVRDSTSTTYTTVQELRLHNTLYNQLIAPSVYTTYLSFWQVKRLKEFSAPRNVSSSTISMDVIQLGLKSRAICGQSEHGTAMIKYTCAQRERLSVDLNKQ